MKTTAWFAILVLAGFAGCTPAQQQQTQTNAQQATQVARKDASVAAKDASNAALAVRVSAAIAAEAGVNAFQVKSSASDGVVTLTGTAPNQRIDRTILDTVRAVPGVKRIVNHITVR
jgi:osmotically-inducible protein OsmY